MNTEWSKLEARYWQGETTLEEEALLRKAALAGEPALSNELRQAMQSIEAAGEARLGDDFDDAFWQMAAGQDGSHGGGAIFTLAAFMRYAAAAAIVVAIALTAFYLVNDTDKPSPVNIAVVHEEDTFTDPEEALRVATEVLGLASEKLNEGQAPVKEIKRFYQSKAAITGMGAATHNNNK